MLLYRVFPHVPTAPPGEPGHPLYLPSQGKGRWDNLNVYQLCYLAHSAEAAIGESFGNLLRWTPAMLLVPSAPGATRVLGVYSFDEESHPVLDLDDAGVLATRAIRPTHVVIRNRPRTQAIAADIYREGKWAGIQWWSFQRPQWTVCALWDTGGLVFDHGEDLIGHPALADAARTLAKMRAGI